MRLLYLSLIIFCLGFSQTSLAEEATKYTCPMHPQIISDKEGTCPICGMDLVPMQTHDHSNEMSEETDSQEKPEITVNYSTIQKMGVRTEKVKKEVIAKEVRAFGNIEENIKNRKAITSRAPGWVTELKTSSIGDRVSKGDLLYKIHSPDMSIAQHDYLLESQRGGSGKIGLGKLEDHYQFSKEALEQLKKTKKTMENIPFYSNYEGVVSKVMISEGDYVSDKMPIAIISDYSSLWVIAEIPEQDLQLISKDSKAHIMINGLPDEHFMATIDYIYPEIDMKTRTAKVRMVLDNTEDLVKVNSYADIIFKTDEQERLVVPSEAILTSSQGKYIVVRKGAERFSPRKIETGIEASGKTEILSGLEEGDEIVVSGQFLIDSESSLQESFREMGKDEEEPSSSGDMIGGSHANH